MGEFRFPKNTKAANSTLHEQVLKLQEEAAEVVEADDVLEPRDLLMETYDVIQAAEGILRKFTKEERIEIYEACKAKCKARGDYE